MQAFHKLIDQLSSHSNREASLHTFTKDCNGKYIEVNQNFARDVGFNKIDEMLGLTDFDLKCLPEKQAIVLKNNNQKIITTGKTFTFIEPVTLFNREEALCLIQKTPLLSRTKKIIGLAGLSLTINKDYFKFLLSSIYLDYNSLEEFCERFNLTNRQYECLRYIARGFTAKQIAKKLNISPRTVEYHYSALKKKLNCNSHSEIIEKLSSLNF